MHGFRRQTFRIYSTLSILWFVLVGPLIVFVFKLPLLYEFVLVILVPADIGALGGYLSRPDKFRPGARMSLKEVAKILLLLLVFFVVVVVFFVLVGPFINWGTGVRLR